MHQGFGAPSGERQKIRQSFTHDLLQPGAGLAVGQRAQRPPEVTNGVVVGIDGTRPVAGGCEIARAFELVC
jgi:hypothetical protein